MKKKKTYWYRSFRCWLIMLFRADNMMISYTAAKEGLNGMEELVEGLKKAMFEDPVEDTRCVLHCEMKNEGFKTASKVQYVARVGNFIDNGADYTCIADLKGDLKL